MATLIRNGRIEPDTWKLPDGAGAAGSPSGDNVIRPLADFLALRASDAPRRGPAGVLLRSTDDPMLLAPHLAHLPLVAVLFERFSDGRGYSIARLLREALDYRGEVRAVGDVLRDQIFYLARCGFDAFVLRADQDATAAVAALRDLGAAYQPAVDRHLPRLRRREAA